MLSRSVLNVLYLPTFPDSYTHPDARPTRLWTQRGRVTKTKMLQMTGVVLNFRARTYLRVPALLKAGDVEIRRYLSYLALCSSDLIMSGVNAICRIVHHKCQMSRLGQDLRLEKSILTL